MDAEAEKRIWEVTRTIKYQIEIERIEDKEESREDAIKEAKIRPTSEAEEESFEASLLIDSNQI
jgi:hypothetical protein